jgi:hypothetical protein
VFSDVQDRVDHGEVRDGNIASLFPEAVRGAAVTSSVCTDILQRTRRSFCGDAKRAIQALDRALPVLPLSPGRGARHGFESVRNGPSSLYGTSRE